MSDGKPVLLDRQGLEKALKLKGFFGRCVSGVLSKVLELDGLNKVYEKVWQLQGPEFSEGTMREIGVTYDVIPQQLERIPKEGGFFTVSNHHFGAVDGMILNSVIGSRRPDHKILTTFFLSLIPNLKDSFIAVDNFTTGGAKSMSGIRVALDHIAQGRPLSLFPAGEVATYQKGANRTAPGKHIVEDKPWADNMIKLIKKSGFPVIPIYFDGTNSPSFHRLGRIHERLRTVRLVHEMLNKKGQNIKVRIGQPINPEEIASMDIETLGKYLRNRCYALQGQCAEAAQAAPQQQFKPVAPHIAAGLVAKDIESVEDRLLLSSGDYKVYLITAQEAPNVMQQIYRLREETFRAIGEGTGLELDTDPYDEYYKHLILWNVTNQEITGAYRIGFGNEIFASHGGQSGFYTSTLFSFGPKAPEILRHSLELGRSFITVKYQREVLPLKMMLAGICIATTHSPGSMYCVGPVSISNSIPDFYKSLIVKYIMKAYPLALGADFGAPTNPFVPNYLGVDPDALLEGVKDIDGLDRLLIALSDGQYRLPVLLRKYITCGARIACFNVDPLFSNSLDGLIVHRLSDFPENTLRSFMRGAPEEVSKEVFKHFYGD